METANKQEVMETKQEIIADVQKSESEIVRLSLRFYKGACYVDIRIFFKDRETGEYHATKKGVTLKRNMVNPFVEAILRADEMLAAQTN